MTGSSGRQRAQATALAAFPLMVPSVEIAEAFAGFVEPIFARITANAREFQTLAALRDLLLPRLMRGEIRVHEAEAAVAGAA